MNKLSISDRALLFIGDQSSRGYQTMTDKDLRDIFPNLSIDRLKHILRELHRKEFLHRKRQKKKQIVDDFDFFNTPTTETVTLINRMNEHHLSLKTKEERAIYEKEMKKILHKLLMDGWLRRLKKKKKKKRGPRPYVYRITRAGFEHCNILIRRGYRVWDGIPMEQHSKEFITWFFSFPLE